MRMLIRTASPDPPWPCQAGAYGPAAIVRSHGREPATGPNRQSPASPAGGRLVTGPLARHSQPAGSTRLSVVVAVRSTWSKQQNRPGARVG